MVDPQKRKTVFCEARKTPVNLIKQQSAFHIATKGPSHICLRFIFFLLVSIDDQKSEIQSTLALPRRDNQAESVQAIPHLLLNNFYNCHPDNSKKVNLTEGDD